MSCVKLGKLIFSRREQLGLSQHALAAKIGCTYKAISNIETGVSNGMKTKFLQPLATALQLPIEQITTAARESRPTLADLQVRMREQARQSPPEALGTHGSGKAADVGTQPAAMPGPQTPPRPARGKAHASPASNYRPPDEFRAVIEEARRQGLSAGEILEMMKKRK